MNEEEEEEEEDEEEKEAQEGIGHRESKAMIDNHRVSNLKFILFVICIINYFASIIRLYSYNIYKIEFYFGICLKNY